MKGLEVVIKETDMKTNRSGDAIHRVGFQCRDEVIFLTISWGSNLTGNFGSKWQEDPNAIGKELMRIMVRDDCYPSEPARLFLDFILKHDRVPTQKEWDKMKLQLALKR